MSDFMSIRKMLFELHSMIGTIEPDYDRADILLADIISYIAEMECTKGA